MRIVISPNRAGDNRILTPREVKILSLAASPRGIEFSSLGVRILLSPFDWVRTLHSYKIQIHFILLPFYNNCCVVSLDKNVLARVTLI